MFLAVHSQRDFVFKYIKCCCFSQNKYSPHVSVLASFGISVKMSRNVLFLYKMYKMKIRKYLIQIYWIHKVIIKMCNLKEYFF